MDAEKERAKTVYHFCDNQLHADSIDFGSDFDFRLY